MIPDVALGAIIAAVIASTVSLLGLIISKEQKTSEFRQAWIDSLRAELTTYATQINAVLDANKIVYPDLAKKVAAMSPHYVLLNEANFSISLRLNRGEERSKKVLSAIKKFNEAAGSTETLTATNLRPIEKEFVEAAQDLLKYEWRRVKQGERSFVVAKLGALCVLALGLIAMAAAVFMQAKALFHAASTPANTRTTPGGPPPRNTKAAPGTPATPKAVGANGNGI